MAVLLYMETDHFPFVEVRNHLSEVVDRVEREHGRLVITKHGRPAAVVLSIEDLQSLEETLPVLSSPRLLADIREPQDERAAGGPTRLSKDEALRLIRRP